MRHCVCAGIVTVNVNGEGGVSKVDAVEQVISQQIDADKHAGMTSFYLVVVPAGERPNTNGALKYIQRRGLLERAIGVFTKADQVQRPHDSNPLSHGADARVLCSTALTPHAHVHVTAWP